MNTKSTRLSFLLIFALLWSSLSQFVAPVAADPLSQLTCSTITPITMSISDHGTGEKPQSKTWTYGGNWWAVFPISSGTWLWKLDQATSPSWTQVLKLSDNTNTHADAKVMGAVVHVLLYDVTNTELVSVEYSGGTYQLWSQRPAVSAISLSGSETATIDIDSTGRMWLTTETSNSIIAYYNDAPYHTAGWNGPITISTFNITSDDISVVTALPGNKIGVLWSNQGTEQFLFRVHNDSDDATTWQNVEEAAANNQIADDHMNVAVASDGTLYAAVKTTGAGQMKMLVRRPNGSWDADYDVDTSQGTRPIVQLNEVAGVVTVIYPTSSGNGGDMIYRESATSSINFGAAQLLQSGSLNDPSSMKENYTDELVVVFFDRSDDTIHGEFCKADEPAPSADLGVEKTGTAGPIDVGETINYTVTVTNHGPETAVNSTITDTLPEGVGFVSATPDNGSSCSENSGIISCALGNLADQEVVEIAIVGTANAPGTLTNSVSVSGQVSDSNSSNNSDTHDTVVTGTLTNLTANPIDDAHVKSDSPTSNYGSLDTLRLRETSDPRYHSYLKFEVAGLVGSVQSATLRLYVTDASDDGGSVYAVSNNYADNSAAWVEGGLTWNNAPALPATPLDSVGTTAVGQWAEWDVTTAVSGNGTFSFGLNSNSSNSAIYTSSEGSNPPQLVIVSSGAEAAATISVNPTSLSSGQQPGTQAVQTLTVGNTGSGDLNWSLFEASAAACDTPSSISWITVSATNGTVAAADSDAVDVTFDSSGMADGSYSANLCVESNDADNPTVSVPLALDVCSPATAVSITNITTSESTQTIAWSGSATDSFQLRWGINDPNFTPGGECTPANNCAVIDKAESSYSHTINPNNFYSYVLVAINSCGPNVVASADSSHTAQFTFAIQPGN
ncbi:MAG: DNRLRE domain-containing protein [Anaerolineales bacterium]|nr:DNRLRE domain-containing protein [Anaerolineales bacterium]